MSNESHPSPTGSSSSSLFGSGAGNETSTHLPGSSPYPLPSKPTWAQVLNSNLNPPSATTTASHRAHSPSTKESHSTGISLSQANTALNLSQTRSTTASFDQQHEPSASASASQTSWSLNFSSSAPWMVDEETQRQLSLAGASSSQQSLDSNPHASAAISAEEGFDQFDSSSPTTDWTKPVTTNNSSANGWSNFPQQQQNVNHPSRSNAPGNSNAPPSNQWPQMDTFYGGNSSTGGSFNLPSNNNNNNSDTMNNNSASSSTWQDPSSSGNTSDTMTLTSSNSSVINKHKSSSTSSMAASLSVALKSAIATGGATAEVPGGTSDPSTTYVPQPRLVEQLGWDEPDIKVAKRPAFDDGTSIWGDPAESASVPVKKWTNGTKAALGNATNLVVQQPQASAVQKPVSATSNQASNSTPPSAPMASQGSSQWNEATASASASNDQISSGGASQQQMNYRSQQSSSNSNWNALPPASAHGVSDDWINDGVVDTSDWCIQNSQNKVPFDPFHDTVDTSDWVVSGGASGGMGGPLPMSSMNRKRFGQDYDLNEGSHDPHSMHRLSNYDTSSMGDPYRQGSDLKNPIMGLGGLLPSAGGNAQLPPHMLPPSQLPFNARPGPMYTSSGILRPINPNGIPTQSGAIMGTGGLISPKLPTSSPVPNQAPYVPLAAKQGTMPNQGFPPGGSQGQPQQGQAPPGTGPMNNGAVHAQIMQQFRLAVQAGLISQDLLNTKLPPSMLKLLQTLFELQQKYQALSIQLADFAKHKQRFPITFFQSEYERLSKLLAQKRQEMLIVQKQIQEAHTKLKQQQQSATSTPTPSQMMVNGPAAQSQAAPGGTSGSGQDNQHGLATDQSRLHQWTKPSASNSRSGQSSGSMFGPPSLSRKDWDNANNNLNENWENTPTNDSATSNAAANVDTHGHNSQGASSTFPDPLADFVDDNDGPPPFVPGQLWNWKATLPTADEDPHVTPSSLTLTSKGSSTSISSMNASGNDSAFSNPQMMQRHQHQRSHWQANIPDQQAFQGASMGDWGKPQQYRGPSKGPSSLNQPPPPPHASFGGYRPYM